MPIISELAQSLQNVIAMGLASDPLGARVGIMVPFLGLRSAGVYVADWLPVRLAPRGSGPRATGMSLEFAMLLGVTAIQGQLALPGSLKVGRNIVQQPRDPLYDRGPNDKRLDATGSFSSARVMTGYLIATAILIAEHSGRARPTVGRNNFSRWRGHGNSEPRLRGDPSEQRLAGGLQWVTSRSRSRPNGGLGVGRK